MKWHEQHIGMGIAAVFVIFVVALFLIFTAIVAYGQVCDPAKYCEDCAPAAELGCIGPPPSLDVVGYEYQTRDDLGAAWAPEIFVGGRLGATIPVGDVFRRALGQKYIRVRAKDGAGNVSPWVEATFRNIFRVTVREGSGGETGGNPPPPTWPPPDPLEITDISYYGAGLDPTSVPVLRMFQLDLGVLVYTDRAYTVTALAQQRVGATYFQTPNADKQSTRNPYMEFTTNKASEVCIARDTRLTVLPTWMAGYVDANEILETTDSTLTLWCQTVAAGRVLLGGNESGGASMYVVVIQEQ